jgi:hypothetical protein
VLKLNQKLKNLRPKKKKTQMGMMKDFIASVRNKVMATWVYTHVTLAWSLFTPLSDDCMW